MGTTPVLDANKVPDLNRLAAVLTEVTEGRSDDRNVRITHVAPNLTFGHIPVNADNMDGADEMLWPAGYAVQIVLAKRICAIPPRLWNTETVWNAGECRNEIGIGKVDSQKDWQPLSGKNPTDARGCGSVPLEAVKKF